MNKMSVVILGVFFVVLCSCTCDYNIFILISQQNFPAQKIGYPAVPIAILDSSVYIFNNKQQSGFSVNKVFDAIPDQVLSSTVHYNSYNTIDNEYFIFIICKANSGNKLSKVTLTNNEGKFIVEKNWSLPIDAQIIIDDEAKVKMGNKTYYALACQTEDRKRLLFYDLNGKLIKEKSFDDPVRISPLEHWDTTNPEDEYIAFDGKRVFAVGGYRDGMNVDLGNNKDIKTSLFLLNESFYDEYRLKASSVLLYDGDTLWSLGLHDIGIKWSKKIDGIEEGYIVSNKYICPTADGIYEIDIESQELVRLYPGSGWKASAEISAEGNPTLIIFSKQNGLDCDIVGFWVFSEEVERVEFSRVLGQVSSLFFYYTDLGKYDERLDLIAFSDKGVYRTANKIVWPPNPFGR